MNIKSSLFSGLFILLLPVCSYANWDSSVSEDEMTGKKSAYASSSITAPTERMGFPYGKVKAWLGVGCDANSEWTYIGFTSSPNLSNTDTKDGYSLIKTRIKWDEDVDNITLSQDWGAKFIHFLDDGETIKNIEKSNTVLLELKWHGEGKTYFKFSLKGSSAALNNIRSECAK